MNFNSFEFIFLFLPISLTLFFWIAKKGYRKAALAWVVLASLFYYLWWNPLYLLFLSASIFVNFIIGKAMCQDNAIYIYRHPITRKSLLVIGVFFNISLLAYFKYTNFFINSINLLAGTDFNLKHILLPLGISFLTFQQISFLVDLYKGRIEKYSFLHYCLYVAFFPKLIAGPITRYEEILPQFEEKGIFEFNYDDFTIGITVFFIGLFKKVVLADNISVYVLPIFGAAEQNVTLSFCEAWAGALGYTFQLYFDFAGYSDMSIGLARMFGICLPLNFYSPYKARSIIEFWNRWHITLSRFLRDYLYIPLGGNRKGKARQYMNLLIVMLICGLWHGASWTFVIWGGIHSIYLMINHAFKSLRENVENDRLGFIGRGLSAGITFTAVVIGWVFFRTSSLNVAWGVLKSMFLVNRLAIRGFVSDGVRETGLRLIDHSSRFSSMFRMEIINTEHFTHIFILFLFMAFVVWVLPNTEQFMSPYAKHELPSYGKAQIPYRDRLARFDFSLFNVLILVFLVLFCLLTMQTGQKLQFLYYDF